MSRSIFSIAALACTWLLTSWTTPVSRLIDAGSQPQSAFDSKGNIRIVFGRNDSIFCSTSVDKGSTFSTAVFVARVKGLHLGMSRGPQLASSRSASVITAMDKAGDIHFFQLDHSKNRWLEKGFVNDQRSSAPEGLMAIAADDTDNFYAVWLDTRLDKKNNIYFSTLTPASGKWSANRLVYQSPDGHVCECCKPNIAVKNGTVAIMFRNWLSGSRDLYVMRSGNRGVSFTSAQKLGTGTWKLNGCPMDGGAIVLDSKQKIYTTWQREGKVYICSPGEKETLVAAGRGSNMAFDINGKLIVSYQDGQDAKLLMGEARTEIISVNGSYLKPISLQNGKLLCIWESNKTIRYATL